MLYKIGDRVRIKSWDRMVDLCENVYTIEDAMEGFGYTLKGESDWEITDDMIECKIEEVDLKEYDDAIRDIYKNWNEDKIKEVFGIESFVAGAIAKHGLKKMLELYKQETNLSKVVVGDILYSKKVDKEMVVTAIREYDHAVNYVGVGRWNGEMCVWSKEGLEKRGHIDLGEIING